MTLLPYEMDCCVCDMVQTDKDIFILGYISILPVAFCENCYQGIVSMVDLLENNTDDDI